MRRADPKNSESTPRASVMHRSVGWTGALLVFAVTGQACGGDNGTGPGDMCPPGLGPIVSYPFSGNANDAVGSNHGTVQGAVLVSDRFGNSASAYQFDGVDDAISIGPRGQAPFPITIALWFNADDLKFAQVLSNDDTNDAANRWGIGMLVSAGQVGANTYEGFSAPWNRVSYWTVAQNLYAPSEWHHVVIVFNENTDRIVYFDGAVRDGVYSGTGSNMVYGGGNGLIGRMHGNSVPKFQFAGTMDDIQIFDRVLTAAEVDQLFTLASGCG